MKTSWRLTRTNAHVCGHQPSTKAISVPIEEYCPMKKYLIASLSMLSLVFAAQAHANSSNLVQEEGPDNEAVVTQTGGVEGESDILQKGSNNFASVSQSEDRVGIYNYGVAANKADIDQEGDGARAVIRQDAWNTFNNPNAATINQIVIGNAKTGNGQIANSFIRQYGIYNRSTINQTGSGISARSEQYGRWNVSGIDQIETSADPFTRAIVYQSGDRNSSAIYQSNSGARADVSQTGPRNISTIDQLVRSGMQVIVNQTSSDSMSDIDQDATAVTASVNQYGGFQDSIIYQQTGSIESSAIVIQGNYGNKSVITQKNGYSAANVAQRGISGDSTIVQKNSVWQPWYRIGGTASLADDGTDNDSSIYQTGDSHTATVTMNGSDNIGLIEQGVGYAGTDMTATVSQTGMDGYSQIRQGGDSGSDAVLTQSGADNKSYIWQDYGIQSAIVTQSGNDNFNEIWQYDTSSSAIFSTQSGDENDSYIYQMHGKATANVTQSGYGNYSYIRQGEANGSTADVDQLGVGSRSTIYQTGMNHKANVKQGYSLNSLSHISQYGDTHTAYVEQNTAGNVSRITQWGSSNTANVYQVTTSGNLSVIRQFGSNNTATVNQ
jgi:hypothetical protein